MGHTLGALESDEPVPVSASHGQDHVCGLLDLITGLGLALVVGCRGCRLLAGQHRLIAGRLRAAQPSRQPPFSTNPNFGSPLSLSLSRERALLITGSTPDLA